LDPVADAVGGAQEERALSTAFGVTVAAMALLAYTYVGYPLLIGLLARVLPWHPRPVPGWEPTVSICVAAYNCEAHIAAKLDSLLALDYPVEKMEILIYSDASTDGTDEIVAAWAAKDPRVRLLRGEVRMGKPTALNRMREQATGEVLVITDSRQPLDRTALRALLSLLGAPEVGCVTGNLVLEGSAGSGV
jgi:poly-beta-1,6-N-acetyl-D-glucosamine synthase